MASNSYTINSLGNIRCRMRCVWPHHCLIWSLHSKLITMHEATTSSFDLPNIFHRYILNVTAPSIGNASIPSGICNLIWCFYCMTNERLTLEYVAPGSTLASIFNAINVYTHPIGLYPVKDANNIQQINPLNNKWASLWDSWSPPHEKHRNATCQHQHWCTQARMPLLARISKWLHAQPQTLVLSQAHVQSCPPSALTIAPAPSA